MGSKTPPTKAEKNAAHMKEQTDRILTELEKVNPEAAALIRKQQAQEKAPETLKEHVRFVLDDDVKALFDKMMADSHTEPDDFMMFLFIQMTRQLNRIRNNTSRG